MSNAPATAPNGKTKVKLNADRAKEATKVAAAKATKTAAPAKRELATVNKNAISADVGVKVLELFDKANITEQKAHALKNEADSGRYAAISMATMAIVKAAKADTGVDLNSAFRAGPAYNFLADQLRLAMGVFQTMTIKGKGGKTRTVLQPTKEAAKFLTLGPRDTIVVGKDDKGKEVRELTESGRRKESVRTNFAHLLKDAAQTAAGIIENNLDAEVVANKGGTLQITGPKIKEHFGVETVTLDEKKLDGMKEKPSFKEVRRIAAEKHGLEIGKTSKDRTTQPKGTAADAFASVVRSFITAVNGVKEVTTDIKKLLEGAQSAIALKLKA